MITQSEFRKLEIGDRVLLTDLPAHTPAYRGEFANREVIIERKSNAKCIFIGHFTEDIVPHIFDLTDIEAIIRPDIKQDFDMQSLEKLLSELT